MDKILGSLNNALLHAVNRGYTCDKNGLLYNGRGIRVNGSINTANYLKFSVKFNNTGYSLSIHRLQAFLKFGDKIFNTGIVVRHKNGNSLDNSWDNILIGTQLDNIMDVTADVRRSMSIIGVTSRDNFPEMAIRYQKMKKMFDSGESLASIAMIYNAPKSTVSFYFGNCKRSLTSEIRSAYEDYSD